MQSQQSFQVYMQSLISFSTGKLLELTSFCLSWIVVVWLTVLLLYYNWIPAESFATVKQFSEERASFRWVTDWTHRAWAGVSIPVADGSAADSGFRGNHYCHGWVEAALTEWAAVTPESQKLLVPSDVFRFVRENSDFSLHRKLFLIEWQQGDEHLRSLSQYRFPFFYLGNMKNLVKMNLKGLLKCQSLNYDQIKH